ncbi:hypothetical protein DPMN_094922 [Dreissena polymorpha]|uniref:Uncharacterized protein n=1 Tax=Dreissena polymorpha TaxID=45954 RepID=A0A9D4L6L3_DREPO|nr:hypothetical protein DPMN_094922 [Dreissena polymorpha]
MECLKNIQQSQMALINRLEAIENFNYDCGYYFDHKVMENYDEAGPSRKRNLEPEEKGEKSSKFASLAKKFKPTEVCGTDIDEYLANNVTDLFRKGMYDELYTKQ